MANNTVDLSLLKELHHAGHLEQAKEGYQKILRINPRNAEVLHALGIIFTQQENFEEATRHLKKSLSLQANPHVKLHLANVLKIQGLYSDAIVLLTELTKTHPHYLPAFNNLGILYFAEESWDQAIHYFKHTIQEKPDFYDAHYNLGLALTRSNALQAAIDAYKTLLHDQPDHVAARFQLACVYMQQERFERAVNDLLAIEALQPHHFETLSNLATCFLKQGALERAARYYQKALELRPADSQILYNLGLIHLQLGQTDHSIQFYQRAIQEDNDNFAAHHNVAIAFLAKPHIGLSLHHFKEALRLQPNNEAIAYNIHRLEQQQPMITAPTTYVETLFDAYADHYEAHLLTALEYAVPELFIRVFPSSFKKTTHWDVLDLGCGTGLSAVPFKPYAKTLVGVDLSGKMLAQAKSKAIYTELHQVELNTFLEDKSHAYDVILAGDVFVYAGQLDSLFNRLQRALRSDGLVIFNAEINEEENYKMNQSGRFTHKKDYLEAVAKENGFDVVAYNRVKTRMQNNQVVMGHVYVMQRL